MGSGSRGVTVRDPGPDNPRKRPLSAAGFANADLVVQARAG